MGVGNWDLGIANSGLGNWQLGVGNRELEVETWAFVSRKARVLSCTPGIWSSKFRNWDLGNGNGNLKIRKFVIRKLWVGISIELGN